jgi:hypothetical protein
MKSALPSLAAALAALTLAGWGPPLADAGNADAGNDANSANTLEADAAPATDSNGLTPLPSDAGMRNPAQRRLARMSDADRNLHWQAYMVKSGEKCGKVTRSFYQGSTESGQIIWNIQCSASGDWQLMVEPNSAGSTKMMPCDTVRSLGMQCWHRY